MGFFFNCSHFIVKEILGEIIPYRAGNRGYIFHRVIENCRLFLGFSWDFIFPFSLGLYRLIFCHFCHIANFCHFFCHFCHFAKVSGQITLVNLASPLGALNQNSRVAKLSSEIPIKNFFMFYSALAHPALLLVMMILWTKHWRKKHQIDDEKTFSKFKPSWRGVTILIKSASIERQTNREQFQGYQRNLPEKGKSIGAVLVFWRFKVFVKVSKGFWLTSIERQKNRKEFQGYERSRAGSFWQRKMKVSELLLFFLRGGGGPF